MAKDTTTEPSTEVEPAEVHPSVLQMGAERIKDEALRSVESFDDAVRLAAEVHGVVTDYAEQYGTGFSVIDKSAFVGKTIMLLDWRFSAGDYGSMVSVVAHAKDGTKGIINDGSTGVHDQLRDITLADGIHGGLMVPFGLTVSDYPTCKECGKPRPRDVVECNVCGDMSEDRSTGHTYYLDQRQA